MPPGPTTVTKRCSDSSVEIFSMASPRPIILASGAGALGVRLGGPLPVLGGEPDFRPELGLGETADADLLPSAVGLGWRALILWLLLMLLLTLANWAP